MVPESTDTHVVITADAARRLTDQIKVAVEATWQLVIQAYESRAWLALGYSSWDDYCSREFGACRLRLPREERQEIVGSLRDAGLSIRAIAAATGVGRGTVEREHADQFADLLRSHMEFTVDVCHEVLAKFSDAAGRCESGHG